MREETAQLFDEFALRYAAGEDPDLRAFLERAGDDADSLAFLIDGYLAGAEPPAPAPERVELMQAWVRGEPPLLELRKRRRLKRQELVKRLTELLGLPPESGPRVAFHYHRLESGLLERRNVDRRVWNALREALGADVQALAAWRPVPMEAAPAYRADAPVEIYSQLQPESSTPAPEDAEVDRLFLSGS